MNYKHTQIGYLGIVIFIIIGFVFGGILMQNGFSSSFFAIAATTLFLLASFIWLNVMIDGTHLGVQFGYGLYSKRFLLNEIVSVEIVKNHWYYGWGIRLWFWPYMWIYNISGFDAVEIRMQSGKIYRIGTDEPKKLEYAMRQAIKK
jgi:hypothetical protein